RGRCAAGAGSAADKGDRCAAAETAGRGEDAAGDRCAGRDTCAVGLEPPACHRAAGHVAADPRDPDGRLCGTHTTGGGGGGRGVRAMTDPRTVIRRPILTEKSMRGTVAGTYTFEVTAAANKPAIKDAVQRLFHVQVMKVNTITIPGRQPRRAGQGDRAPPGRWTQAVLPRRGLQGRQRRRAGKSGGSGIRSEPVRAPGPAALCRRREAIYSGSGRPGRG